MAGNTDPSSAGDGGSQAEGSQSVVKKQNNPDRQSPIDFVIEKQQCEIPDIPGLDGGD